MWYDISMTEKIISPSLLFYKERVESNIDLMIRIAGSAERLIPHVKTHKCSEIVKIQISKGISKFKCATIAEAEMLAESGAQWILIAYQMVGPNLNRFYTLKRKYSDVRFACLVDNVDSAALLNEYGEANSVSSDVFIDVNNGMNRTGSETGEKLFGLFQFVSNLPHVSLAGIHIYDGHIGNADFSERKNLVDTAYETVTSLFNDIKKPLMIIAGGSPSFTVHAQRSDVFLSPGTNVLWDWGYGSRLHDQPFLHAALILTRVISKPSEGIITIDLGHKAVSAENPIDKRFQLLNLSGYTVMSQSEEHGVIKVSTDQWEKVKIGQPLYALPYHICPTVALHDYASVIENSAVSAEWKIEARSRRITI